MWVYRLMGRHLSWRRGLELGYEVGDEMGSYAHGSRVDLRGNSDTMAVYAGASCGIEGGPVFVVGWLGRFVEGVAAY